MASRTQFDDDIAAVVAIPVRDEAERIGECLLALNQPCGFKPGIVLLINNTRDQTTEVVRGLLPALTYPVHVIEHDFPPNEMSAGTARQLAMQLADRLAPAGVPLLTTDADGRVTPDWLDCNMAHLRQGADAVFGRAVIDPDEALQIPSALHEADARECAYWAVLVEIEHLIDPDPADPWPRHAEHSGCSIAVARKAYRSTGGIPALLLGEDRAFYHALRQIDAKIRHAPEVSVVVSGRILGRAAGGMADTICRRLVSPDTLLDEALEPAWDWVRRIRARREARHAFRAKEGECAFGAVWADLSTAMPSSRVPVTSLPHEMASALTVLGELRAAELAAAD